MEEELLLAILNGAESRVERSRRRSQHIPLRNLRDDSNPFTVSHAVFVRNFRMPQNIALKLIEKLKVYNDLQYSTIPFHLKVLSALNFFATGSYQNSVGYYNNINMSHSSISRSVEYISNMLNEHLDTFIKFPTNTADEQEVKNGFLSKYGILNTIGCIDCTHVAIVSPPGSDDVHPPRLYRNRKRFYSINVEAICDSNLMFLYVNTRYPGSCHDSAIWTRSPIRHHIQHLNSQSGCWIGCWKTNKIINSNMYRKQLTFSCTKFIREE